MRSARRATHGQSRFGVAAAATVTLRSSKSFMATVRVDPRAGQHTALVLIRLCRGDDLANPLHTSAARL